MAAIIYDKPWNYTIYDRDGEWILTLLIGGVVDVPVSIVLSRNEVARIKQNPEVIEELVEAVRVNRKVFANRELKPVFRG